MANYKDLADKTLIKRFNMLSNDRQLKEALEKRANFNTALRQYFGKRGFLEIETPILAPKMNEYIEAQFDVSGGPVEYNLPQSAQLYKQLLVLSGVDRYFQLSRCFRSDVISGNKQPEFTQVDLEMKADAKEQVMNEMENVFRFAADYFQVPIPDSIPEISYDRAMAEYGTDAPYSKELELCWVTGMPLFKQTDEGLVIEHHPVAKPTEQTDHLLYTTPQQVRAESFDLVYKGVEVGGGDLRNHHHESQRKVLELLGHDPSPAYNTLLYALEKQPVPHGGCALGLERILCLFMDRTDIKEVFSFPKYHQAEQ